MSSSSTGSRYRLEGAKSCIDIQLTTAHQLFNGRDPAPFRERDIDDDAVEHILSAMQDLPRQADVKIALWITEAIPSVPASTITDALQAHFRYEVERFNRRIRDHVVQGQLSLLLGIAVLVVFLTCAELTRNMTDGHLRQVLREGLIIMGWVAMWRPLDALLYDWWPLVRQRRRCERVLAAEIAVHHAAGPGHGHAP